MKNTIARLRTLLGFLLAEFLLVIPLRATLNAPATLSISGLKATEFTLKWTAASGATDGIAGYDVYRDNELIGSTPATPRSLAVTDLYPLTSYTMTVVARDGAGNFSTSSPVLTVTTLADTRAPARPTALSASALTTTSFTLQWTAPLDNIGVTAYQIYRASELIGSSTTTTFNVTGVSPDTIHRMTVRARDAAGNLSAASAALKVRSLAEPPSVPQDLTVSNLKAASFTLRWTAATGGTGGIAGYDVFRNGSIYGTTTKKAFRFREQTPLTTYDLTVASRDHEDRVSAQSAVLLVSTPADTNKPSVPKDLSAAEVSHHAFTLSWTPSTDNVGVSNYEVLRNNAVVGSPLAASFPVTGLAPLTAYTMKVRAKDAAGNVSGLSAALLVTTAEAPNVQPSVSLSAPANDAFFTLPVSLTLAASAADPDGLVTKVEFFDRTFKLGETLTASTPPDSFTLPVTLADPGAHLLFARATDNRNATADSPPVSIRLLPGLPYTAGFEEGEGYLAGALQDQLGWTVADGVAEVTSDDSSSGDQSVRLEPGAVVTLADQELGAGPTNPTVAFIDIFAKPVAGATPGSGSRFDLDSARIAFVHNGTVGRLAGLNGDGLGAGVWQNLAKDIPIDANRASSAWLRLTARLDYAAKTWDLYLDGHLLAYDLKFRSNAATYVSGLSIQGHPNEASSFDDLYAGAINPLFSDEDHDGMDDDWESAHGLNPTHNDRNADIDQNGLTNIEEYLRFSSPSSPDADEDGLPDTWEMQFLGSISPGADDDSDGDGLSNLQEFLSGTDPSDFYNGQQPVVTQFQAEGNAPREIAQLVFMVTNTESDPLIGAPVVLTALGSEHALSPTWGDRWTNARRRLEVRTDASGIARFYMVRTDELLEALP